MVQLEITRDAKGMLKLLYSLYRSGLDDGKKRSDANYFGSSEDIQKRYFSAMSVDDVTDICFELVRADCLTYCPGDDLANDMQLTSLAIVYCEQSFERNTKELLEWVSTIKGVIPFV